MPAAIVQVNASANNSSNATYTVTCGQSVAIGDLIIVIATSDGVGTLTSITDAPDGVNFTGNTYTAFVNNVLWDTSTHRFGLFYSVATQALVSGVSKIKFTTGGATNKALQVLKMTGANTISADGVGNSSPNQASTLTPASGSFTTTQAKELVVVAHAYDNVATPSYTAPAGYTSPATTQLILNGAVVCSSMAYKFVTSTGAQSGAGTLSQTNVAGGLIGTFKYADSGNQYGPALNPGAVDVCANDMQASYLAGPAGAGGSGQLPMVGVGA